MKILKNSLIYTFLDYPDNFSLAVTVIIPGCNHYCVGCHSKELWGYNSTDIIEISVADLFNLIKESTKITRTFSISHIVLLGGDPLYDENLKEVNELLKYLEFYDVCIYTGYSVAEARKRIKGKFKYLKCNKFDINSQVISEKTMEYIQFASTNQELYNEKYELLSENGRFNF